MSSESTSYYIVQRNAEIEEAARQAALTATQQCSREFDELRAAGTTFASRNADTGITVTLPDAPVATSEGTSTRARAEAHLADWRRKVAEARRLIDQAHSRAASCRFLGALRGGAGPRTARDVVQDVETRQAAADTSRWLEDIERILADTLAAPADVERLLQEAQGLRDLIAAGHSAGPAIESFRQRVAAATADYEARQREVADAIELQASLAGLTGEEADAARRELLEVQSGQQTLSPALRATVAQVARRAKAAADDRWVARLVEQELAKLGYQVEPGFSTETGDVTHLQVHRREWMERDGTVGHDVVVAFDPHAEKADGAIEIFVRHASDQGMAAAQRNLAVEKQWCEHFPQVLHRLKQHAVTVWVPPGSVRRPQAAHPDGRRVLVTDSTGRRTPHRIARINRRGGP